MKTTIELITDALKTAFHDADIVVKDDKEEHIGHAHQDSGHFTVMIKSAAFEGKTPIQQHRMVYAALGTLMEARVHALRIQASTKAG